MTKSVIRITIADDHPIFRQGLRQIIESDPMLEVVAEAGDGHAAIERIEALAPDVAILDVSMPGRDGLEVTRAVRDRRLPTAVICLTMHKDARFVNAALDAGVKGYVLKDSAAAEIVQCTKAVHAGQSYISPVLSTYLITRRQRAEALASRTPGIEDLTATERKVLGLIAELKTTKQIASVLCVSPRTVDHHRANIAAKLELHGSHALTRFAIEHRAALHDG
ncbi:MAG: response regulator [Luteitalea sp.]|nr:response regulator [Luteitalea sp.]